MQNNKHNTNRNEMATVEIRNCINNEQKFTDIKLMLLDIKTASLDQLKWSDNGRSVELVEELFIV